MRLTVVDYIGNSGGGLRFTVETLKALTHIEPEIDLQLVSHGAALEAYRTLLARESVPVRLIDIAPGIGPRDWHFIIPDSALATADVVWLPWVHRHRASAGFAAKVVGSFHDAIILTEPSLQRAFATVIPDEWETTHRWLRSGAKLVVSSQATVSTMVRSAGADATRFIVIPTSGGHVPGVDELSELPPGWDWSAGDFLLCPANITAHKNHEVLLDGFSRWGQKKRLVLTGSAAELPVSRSILKRYARSVLEPLALVTPNRSTFLRRFARKRGIRIGDTLVPLGYVTDAIYYSLLRRAWALVMPTRAEGGGSFPVEEAVRMGVPVISSNIPVMREHMDRIGATVLWFDPNDPSELKDRLDELLADYERIRTRAARQVASLSNRSWHDVAREYMQVFGAVAGVANS